MSRRHSLPLLAAFVGVLLTYLLPSLRQLELVSYDYRLLSVRASRGNVAPSRSIRMLGRSAETYQASANWNDASEQKLVRVLKQAGATQIWVDPLLHSPLPVDESGTPVAYTDLRPDEDNVVRNLELATAESLSPAVELFAKLQGVPLESVEVTPTSVKVGNREFPRVLAVDYPTQSATEDYLKPQSMHLALAPRNEAWLQSFDGTAILLVNSTQEARHRFGTPVGDLERYQLEFAALDTLQSGWTLRPLPLPWSIVLALGLGLLLAKFTFHSHNIYSPLLVWVIVGGCYWRLALRAFVEEWSLPVVPVIIGSLIAMTAVAAIQQFRAYNLMARLLGRDRAGAAARGESALGGAERIVTILFTNLPSAIQALEQTDPEASIHARNRYGAILTEVVRKHDGWVLDYQGDFQMAGFGAEKLDDQHALHAVRAGLELVKELKAAYPDESLHCGICTGPAAVGLVGAPSAKALAAIGDTTNVAARLTGAAKGQNVDVLISEPTQELCADAFVSKKLAPVDLKGKAQKVEVYSVERER